MNRRTNNIETTAPAAWARRAANAAAVLGLGLGVALGAFAAPMTNSPTGETGYSWPSFHGGGTTDGNTNSAGTVGPPVAYTDPNLNDTALGLPQPPYAQQQGTPSGVVTNGGNSYATEIPSHLLGNYNPAAPPADSVAVPGTPPGTGIYYPNHFRDGGYIEINGPFAYTYPIDSGASGTIANPPTNPPNPTPNPAGSPDVEGSPVAVNATDYPRIADCAYYGTQVATTKNGLLFSTTNQGTAGTPDPIPYGGGITDAGSAGNQSAEQHAIRQVVYFTRTETVPVILISAGKYEAGGVPMPAGTSFTPTTPVGDVVGHVTVGAVYAMDGFTGGIIWRYQIPSFSTAQDGNFYGYIHSTPAVARINIDNSGTPHTVVVVTDNNGFVYCLNAVGNGDGYSNSDVVAAPATATTTTDTAGVTTTTYTPANLDYDTTTAQANGAAPLANGTYAHIGTTNAYWVYRPDATQPRTAQGATDTKPGSDHNLPVPASFDHASPTIYVVPHPIQPASGNPVTTVTTAGGVTLNQGDGIIYVGNSNGTLYALDSEQMPTATAAFDGSRATGITAVDNAPTCNPIWWFASGQGHIDGTPALWLNPNSTNNGTILNAPTVYFGTSLDESIDGNSAGRLWAVDGINGPIGNSHITTATTQVPGAPNYNTNPRAFWSFPDSYGNDGITATGYYHQSTSGNARPALGDISGSPVVFYNPDAATSNTSTNVYFAANSGIESPATSATNATGRVWSVNAQTGAIGMVGGQPWVYPQANDPNNAAADGTAEPSDPIEGFNYDTPAIGIVQYPKTIRNGDGTYWTHTDTSGTVTFNGDAATGALANGPSIPMLYIGTFENANVHPAFYELDLDGAYVPNQNTVSNTGAGEAEKLIFRQPGPFAGFESSPALVVNSSTSGGNGGVVYIVDSGTQSSISGSGTLYEIQATPVTNVGGNSNTGEPDVPFNDLEFSPAGPYSSPAIAAATVTNLPGIDGNLSGDTVRDWVYVGDSSLGLMYGLTPDQNSFGTTVGVPAVPPVYSPTAGINSANNFPLRAYLFDGTAAHPGTTLNMNLANPVYGNTTPPSGANPLAAFEWGSDCYIRIANVVPPAGALDANGNPEVVVDPNATTPTAYGDGHMINITLQDTSVAGSGAAFTDLLPNVTDHELPQTTTGPSAAWTPATAATQIDTSDNGRGFYRRTDTGTTGTFSPPETGTPDVNLVDGAPGTGNGWIYAYTYHVAWGDGLYLHNTPGAVRRVLSAVEQATVFTQNGAGVWTPTGQTVTLNLQNGSVSPPAAAGQNATNGKPSVAYDLTQPTFGILNPLALRGGGVPLLTPGGGPGTYPVALGFGNRPFTPIDGIGPFRTVTDLLNPQNMEALANGDLVYNLAVPPSGYTGSINSTTYPQTLLHVITSTGQIGDGSQGDNTNPANLVGSGVVSNIAPTPETTPLGGPPVGTPYGATTLDLADRSLLGGRNEQLQISIHPKSLLWNDNVSRANHLTTAQIACVNPLPWETPPSLIHNTSPDYPNIPVQDVTHEVTTSAGPDTSVNAPTDAPLDPANVDTATSTITTFNLDPVRVLVNVPKYQPANLELLETDNAAANGTPTSFVFTSPHNPTTEAEISSGNISHDFFPMGYHAVNERITFAAVPQGGGAPTPPNLNGPAAPFRDVSVYTGVPVDIRTSITNPTTDIGLVPHGFGVQSSNLLYNGAAIGPFTPYNLYPGYAGHWQPLNIVSDSNVNLIDPHLDQKILAPGQPLALPLLADALNSSPADPYSYIPAYDGLDGLDLTGPRTAPELPFLVRSSLDTDLGEIYGRNPAAILLAGTNAGSYPTVTLHKPRVGDGQGTTMTVPDVPHDSFAPGYLPTATPTGNLPALVVNTQMTPPALVTPLDTNGVVSPSNTLATARPYVSVAVPIGTPVGTYSQNLRLFEGYDPNYSPLLGPTYNGNFGGNGAFNPSALDTFQLVYNGSVPHALQPYSDPATQLKVSVGEDRMTNLFTPGALPMIDLGASGPNNANNQATDTANFAPFAYRDPNSGSLSLFWTTTPRGTAAGQSQYNVTGFHLPYVTNGSFFTPANPGTSWWGAINGFPGNLPAGNNVGWNVAVPQVALTNGIGYGPAVTATTGYAFDTNISTAQPYPSAIYCYSMDLATGTPSGTPLRVADSPQPKSQVHGLTFSGVTFTDPNKGANIPDNLWAFWTGGTRGQTALYYSPANTAAGTVRFGTDVAGPGLYGQPAVLPIPAGLVAVSDPTPVLTNAPDVNSASGAATPSIEVTYSGIGASGHPDIYLSRYQPYRALIGGQADTAGTTPNSRVLLGLMPLPSVNESLQPAATNLTASGWWQARDVGWVRNNNLQIQISVLNNGVKDTSTISETGPNTFTQTYVSSSGTTPATPPGQIVADRASGILVFTNVTLPLANGTALTPMTGQTMYVDPAGGRIRFSIRLPVPFSPSNPNVAVSTVNALFNPTARRITTGTTADTEPIAFLDEAYQPNTSGVATDPNVQADRYWFLWRKAAVGKVNPTLWYKSQRLTVALTDTNGLPTSIQAIPAGQTNAGDPNVIVNLVTNTGAVGPTLYQPGGGTSNVVDVDATRGRLYFPITLSGTVSGTGALTAMEGQHVDVTYYDSHGNKITLTGTTLAPEITWQDEPLYNDTSNQNTPGAEQAFAADGYLVPINTIVNESGVSAFLDPLAYQNTQTNTPNNYNPSATIGSNNIPLLPHNLWLFWTSTRNGTPDLYYETMNPRFTAVTANGTP